MDSEFSGVTTLSENTKALSNAFNSAGQTMVQLRENQLGLEAKAFENERRINELHEALKKTHSLNTSKRKSTKKQKSAKSDSLIQKIKTSFSNLTTKIASLFKSDDDSNEMPLADYIRVLDIALGEDLPQGESFLQYFYNSSADEAGTQPSEHKYQELFTMIASDFVKNDPELDLKGQAANQYIRRFIALSTDRMLTTKDLVFDEKARGFEHIKEAFKHLIIKGFGQPSFDEFATKSEENYLAILPKLAYLMVKDVKENSRDLREFKTNLVPASQYMGVYLDELSRTMNDSLDTEDKQQAGFVTLVNEFIEHAQKPDTETTKMSKYFKDKEINLELNDSERIKGYFDAASSGLIGENINGSSSLFSQKIEDSAKAEDKQMPFEKQFANVLEFSHALLDFKVLSEEDSSKLAEWALSEVDRSKKLDLKSIASSFIVTVNDLSSRTKVKKLTEAESASLKGFAEHKDEIIALYLADSFNFDKTGNLDSIDNKSTNLLIDAVIRFRFI